MIVNQGIVLGYNGDGSTNPLLDVKVHVIIHLLFQACLFQQLSHDYPWVVSHTASVMFSA